MSPVVWPCHACGQYRDDPWISVAHRKVLHPSLLFDPLQLNARYCNDRPLCLIRVASLLDVWAQAVGLQAIGGRVRGNPPKEPGEFPSCDGCGDEVISVPEVRPLYRVRVQHPEGTEVDGGSFCLGCMLELAFPEMPSEGLKRGLRLWPEREEKPDAKSL